MGKEKRVLRIIVLSLAGIFLLLLLWGLSPGPEQLARFTAERYAQRYACDYSYHALVMEARSAAGWLGRFRYGIHPGLCCCPGRTTRTVRAPSFGWNSRTEFFQPQ